MARVTTPLASHGVLRTTDVDDARESLAASLAPHRLTVLRGIDAFEVLHNTAELGRVSLHYIDYGSEVEVTVEHMGFYLVQIPLGGVTTIQSGTSTLAVTPRSAGVNTPNQAVRMRYSAGNPRLLVRVAADLLRERLVVAAEGGVVASPRTGDPVDITGGAGRTWRGLVDLVVTDFERDSGLSCSPLAMETLQLAVVDGLVAALAPHSSPTPGHRSAPERVIRRAARLIEEHCAEPLGTPDVAEAIGISIRALQAGFRAHLNTTPMAHMRHARLVRVRESLMDGSARSVADAASRWGVTHLGRLSSDYRATFGESPRDTFRRSR